VEQAAQEALIQSLGVTTLGFGYLARKNARHPAMSGEFGDGKLPDEPLLELGEQLRAEH